MPGPLWTPAPERVRNTQLYAFMQRCSAAHGFACEWEALRQWSIDCRDLFWTEMLTLAGVEPSRPATAAYAGEGMLQTRWFPGLTLNYARHLLRTTAADDSAAPAIIVECEHRPTRILSRGELRGAVARCAAALRAAGVAAGDRVAGYLPNIPETVIAMLAAASLGAIWSSCSPDFGVRAVVDRFGQIEPAVLIAADGYHYGGKAFPVLDRVREIASQLPGLRRLVIVPWLNGGPDLRTLPEAVSWEAFLASGPAAELSFTEVPFDHPLFIMYSSGTTGVPKCIVHGHGGTLLQHAKEHILHCDLRAGEKLFYFTTCGWMMWNWLVSGLGVGAAIVLFEGNPTTPTAERLWRVCAEHRVEVFGTSPKFLALCRKLEQHPGRDFDLARLRALLATGSPLTDDLFTWTYANVKADLQLSSISGGTDIISCFMLGNPILPVYSGQIQCRGLGMDVHAWDDHFRPLIGARGELVCCSPFPSQPVGFWNDAHGAKYRAAYFDYYTHALVWRHGDFIEIMPNGGVIVYGRSDATLNPGGVRIGTAEIYRVVETLPDVTDSIVIGRPVHGDVEICLFLVLKPGLTLTREMCEQVRKAIAESATRRHVPRHIRQVSAVPYTVSGKKVELAVLNVLQGEEVRNRDALANPEVLEQYRGILEGRNGNGNGNGGGNGSEAGRAPAHS